MKRSVLTLEHVGRALTVSEGASVTSSADIFVLGEPLQCAEASNIPPDGENKNPFNLFFG